MPILALVGHVAVKTCQTAASLPSMSRTLGFACQRSVSFAQEPERGFQRLRSLEAGVITPGEKNLQPKIKGVCCKSSRLTGAHKTQLLAVLFEHRVIAHSGPLPAAACGLTLAGGIAPQRHQRLRAQALEPLDPGAPGQRSEQVGG